MCKDGTPHSLMELISSAQTSARVTLTKTVYKTAYMRNGYRKAKLTRSLLQIA